MNFDSCMNMGKQNLATMMSHDTIKQIDFVIKTNQRVAEAVGPIYINYLQRIFQDLL